MGAISFYMTIKISPYLIILVLVVTALLLLGVIKGCNNTRSAVADNEIKSGIIARLKSDSLKADSAVREYEFKLDLQDGQIELWQNRFFSNEDSLDAARGRIDGLITMHNTLLKKIPLLYVPRADTSNVYVPGEYVDQCEGCFGELNRSRYLVLAYKISADSLTEALKQKNKIDSAQLKYVTDQNAGFRTDLNTALSLATKNQPRGSLYVSWGVFWNPLPSAAGMGLMYQSKYKVGYALRWYYGKYGSMMETELNLPLSFKKR